MKKLLRKLKSKKGFTLAEILVGLALVALISTMSYNLFNLGNELVRQSFAMVKSSNNVAYAIKSDSVVDNVGNKDTGSETINIIDTEITVLKGSSTISYKTRKSSDGSIEYIYYE